MNDQLNQAVIHLHDIARLIESNIGSGQLSEDVRGCADRLHALLQPLAVREQNYVQS